MVPAPRRCHGSVQYTDEKSGVTSVVISGGYNGDWVFSDVWRLDLGTLQWTRLSECILPCPVYFHSAALTPEGRMYIFGGIVKMNNKVIIVLSQMTRNILQCFVHCSYFLSVIVIIRRFSSLQVQRTNAVHSAWLTIPKLSEICWQALNYYYPKLKDCSPDELLHMGVPLKFVQRLDFYDWWTIILLDTPEFSNLSNVFYAGRTSKCLATLRSFDILIRKFQCNFFTLLSII